MGETRENVGMEEGATCPKFCIILGAPHGGEVLAELHIRYPWVQLTRRINGAGNAMLIANDERSKILLTDLKAINGKECSFRPLWTKSRKTYIMMEVPPCVTEELPQQDRKVLEVSRMTKLNTEKETW